MFLYLVLSTKFSRFHITLPRTELLIIVKYAGHSEEGLGWEDISISIFC